MQLLIPDNSIHKRKFNDENLQRTEKIYHDTQIKIIMM